MQDNFHFSQWGIKLVAWMMSGRAAYEADVSSFLTAHGGDAEKAHQRIMSMGLERDFFEVLDGLEKENIDWLMVGVKVALLNNVAFQNYGELDNSAFNRASYQCRLALEEANVSFDDREKFEELAVKLKQAPEEQEKLYLLRKVEELLRAVTSTLAEARKKLRENAASEQIRKEIKEQIAAGEIDKAFENCELLDDYQRIEREVIILRGRYAKLNSQMRRGLLSKADADLEYNNIIDGMLELVTKQ